MTATNAALFTTPLQQALLGPQGVSLQAAAHRRLSELQAQLRAHMGEGLARDAFTAAERLARMLEHALQVLDSLACADALPPIRLRPDRS